MICTRCGSAKAHTEAECTALAAKGGPTLPAGICFRCAWEDPALHKALSEWAERKKAETYRRVREFLIRPLEFIDRLVDGLR
jgi:hypothetical protein